MEEKPIEFAGKMTYNVSMRKAGEILLFHTFFAELAVLALLRERSMHMNEIASKTGFLEHQYDIAQIYIFGALRDLEESGKISTSRLRQDHAVLTYYHITGKGIRYHNTLLRQFKDFKDYFDGLFRHMK